MLRIAICEDFEKHRTLIKGELAKTIAEEYTVHEFGSLEAFRKTYLADAKGFDIILMDIELEDGAGIELGDEINSYYPLAQIIYITSHTHYFSEVYDTEHVWFINKNEMEQYLQKAIQKARKALWHSRSPHLNFAWQKVKYSIVQDEIIYIERCLRVSEIHTRNGVYKTSEKLEELMKQLTSVFVFCHRSYIINMKNITKLQKGKVVLNNDIEIPISRAREEELKKVYNMFLVH